MNLDLHTDIEFQNKKIEIESKIDDLIEDSKLKLSLKIKEQLKNEEDNIIEEALKIIEADLEEKRINIKKYFISQIETITILAFDNAIKKIMA